MVSWREKLESPKYYNSEEQLGYLYLFLFFCFVFVCCDVNFWFMQLCVLSHAIMWGLISGELGSGLVQATWRSKGCCETLMCWYLCSWNSVVKVTPSFLSKSATRKSFLFFVIFFRVFYHYNFFFVMMLDNHKCKWSQTSF